MEPNRYPAAFDDAQIMLRFAPEPAPKPSPDRGSDASGHRGRLRQRLIDGGPDALLDHELVEYLLALAIPRRDTKPMARMLIDEFGGLGPLLSADPESLARAGLSGGVVAALKIAEASALRLLKSRMKERPILSDWKALADYLRADMAHRAIERVRVLHLNSKNMLIRDELVSEGSIDQAAVHVREVIRRALELHSAALIIVHNHPSGDPQPSRQDVALTKELIAAAKPLGISVHDHIIVGGEQQASLRSLGLI
jgi:DNA repair protein RadC